MSQALPPPAGAAAASVPPASPPPPLPIPDHTWTGDAACFLPRPAPTPAVAGCTAKFGSGGWLKAAAPARLRIVASRGGRSAALELTLPKQALLRADLGGAGGDAAPAAGGGSSGGGSGGDGGDAPRLLAEQRLLLVPQVRG